MIGVKPLGDRVLISQEQPKDVSDGGIIIPDIAKQKSQIGNIVAVADDTDNVKMSVKIGDKVLFGKHSGSQINIDGIDYLLMRESDIFSILETNK